MHSVNQAQDLILQHARPLPAETADLGPGALGLVLAEDVVSDLDMPPYDKAMMDGYAVRTGDLAGGSATLTVIEEVTAGRTPERTLSPGQATRIMTGAPIPPGAEAVVQVERTRMVGPDQVRVEDQPGPGQNIMSRATEMRAGDVVLAAGAMLRPPEFGVLATVGRTTARVIRAPRVAVLSTGDEVVEPGEKPGPGQIRNSNGPLLLAQSSRAGASARYLGIARDSRESLRSLVGEGLRDDVLILSGGVSAGKLDLVPGVLADAGVVAHVHKVEMKPGKPVYFGVRPPRTLVFGLPGNPVSALVCFELFIHPSLRRLRGLAEPGPVFHPAVLAEDYHYRTDRPTYHPALVEGDSRGWRVRTVPWQGSPDLRALARANALVLLPPGDLHHRAGQTYPVLPLEY